MIGKRKKGWLNKNLAGFVSQYARKSQRGVEPNDRKYDRKIEQIIKNMDPAELSSILSDPEDEPLHQTKTAAAESALPRSVATGLTLRIISWSDKKAWTTWSGTARSALIGRLQSASPNMRPTDIKRLARSILNQECSIIKLPEPSNLEPIRHLLEAIGAEVEIEEN